MEEKKNYITPGGLARLRAEYHQLMHVERPKIVEVVAWAASNGDRSENADYQYGKRRLREIDKRVHFLTKRIEDAEIVDPVLLKAEKIVRFSATVTIANEDGDEIIYQIVGEDDDHHPAQIINKGQPRLRWSCKFFNSYRSDLIFCEHAGSI